MTGSGRSHVLAANRDRDWPRCREARRNGNDGRVNEAGKRPRAHPIRRNVGGAEPRITVLRKHNGDLGFGIDCDIDMTREGGIAVQTAQPPQRRKPPLLFPATRHAEVVRIEGLKRMQPRDGAGGFDGPCERAHQPTAPSICSSMSRFSSSAYSIGSSRAIGSTKPRTMVAIASSSVMPRLIR